jgi:hypothetical protein
MAAACKAPPLQRTPFAAPAMRRQPNWDPLQAQTRPQQPIAPFRAYRPDTAPPQNEAVHRSSSGLVISPRIALASTV